MIVTAVLLSLLTGGHDPAGAITGSTPITDAAALGGVTLFNAVGSPISTGSDLTHIADYAQASSAQAGTTIASIAFALPTSQADPTTWSTASASSPTNFPVNTLGASLGAPTQPTVAIPTDAGDLGNFLGSSRRASTVELRLFAGSGGAIDPSRYWASWLTVDPVAGTWALTASAANSAGAGPVSVTLTSPSVAGSGGSPTVTSRVAAFDGSHPAGTIALFDGNDQAGNAQYAPATGEVTVSPQLGGPTVAHHYRLQFTPADTSRYGPGSSSVFDAKSSHGLFLSVSTSLLAKVVPPAGNQAYGTTTLTVWIRPAGATGSVEFTDSIAGRLGSVRVHDGQAILLTNALGSGKHSIVVKFNPSSSSYFNCSQLTPPPFTLSGSAAKADAQTAHVSVTSGELTISTPYTPDHPFSLGNLVLDPAGTKLFASAHFGSAQDAALKGITITDTRSGNQGWTASVGSTNFVSSSNSISAENLGFVGVRTKPGVGGLGTATKPVLTHDVPPSLQLKLLDPSGQDGLAGLPKPFASATHGGGSVYIYGDMLLSAPTTTPVGDYTATLTFTVG